MHGSHEEDQGRVPPQADQIVISGRDEASVEASLALNQLAMAEARDYTKLIVGTSQGRMTPESEGLLGVDQLTHSRSAHSHLTELPSASFGMTGQVIGLPGVAR